MFSDSFSLWTGEFHPYDKHDCVSIRVRQVQNSEQKSSVSKDPQHVFFLLWQQELRQFSARIYNVLKSMGKGKMPVSEFKFFAGVLKSDESIEANLSTIFQSVKKYCSIEVVN